MWVLSLCICMMWSSHCQEMFTYHIAILVYSSILDKNTIISRHGKYKTGAHTRKADNTQMHPHIHTVGKSRESYIDSTWLKMFFLSCALKLLQVSLFKSSCPGLNSPKIIVTCMTDNLNRHTGQTNSTVQCIISQALRLAYEILTPAVLCKWGQKLGFTGKQTIQVEKEHHNDYD